MQRPAPLPEVVSDRATKRSAAPRERVARTKLTFKETRELETLPDEIESLAAEQHAITERMCAAGYHQQPADVLRSDRERAQALEHLLAQKFERWAELDAKAAGGS